MISNINQIKSSESKKKKSESFFNNVKEAVNNVLNPNTGKRIKDITAATLAALLSLSSCHDDLDTTPPRIDIIQKNIEISGGEALRVNGNQVYIGNTLVFRCSDDVSENPTKSFTFSGNPISPGYSFDKSGSISMKARDEAGNVSNAATSQINKKEVIDEIKFTVLKSQVDFSKGGETSIKDKAFFVGNEKVVTWTDDNYTPSLKFDGKDVEIGYVVENEGVLTFTLTNDKGVSKSTNINTVNGNEAPEIQIKRSEANIFGGVKITLKDNKLLFGNVVMAEGTDDNTENLHMKFEADGKEIKSGETLNISTEGTHTGKLTATDDKNKSSTKEIKLENNVNKVVSGLDNLNNLNMQTDQEVNLLNGISFNGVELIKVEVEINGQRQQVSDPKHYTPNSAGTCKIIFTVKGEFGNSGEIKSKELTIKGPEYIAPTLETANVIDEHYPWFNNLTQRYKEFGYDPSVWNNKKDFVYPHVLTSYITGERYRWDNMEYIIVGEIPAGYECEDVGPNGSTGSGHASGGYEHIKNSTPFANIKACGGSWEYVIKYVNSNPKKLFMLSCAADAMGGDTPKELKFQADGKTIKPMYSALKELLQKENVIVSVASGNVSQYSNRTFNEDENPQGKYEYNSSSVNSEKNNKITVVGYNPPVNNVFRDDEESNLVFGSRKGNIIIPFTNLVANDNTNLTGSASSRPTATLSSTLGNHLSVIMRNHPGTTLEDASTILQQKYLYPETFKYKDTDGTIKDGGTRYKFNSDKFRDEELLHKSEIEAVTLSGDIDIVQLPSGRGLCYVGPGIQFEYKGKKYDFIKENKSKFMEIVANNDIKWYRNKESCTKYGGKGNIELNVYVLDTHGKKLPDVQLKVTKSVR